MRRVVVAFQAQWSWRHVKFEWRLLAFGIGIAMYFAWPKEPHLFYVGFVMVLLGLIYFAFRASEKLSDYFILAVVLVIGFAHARVHTINAFAPVLPIYKKVYTVSGWIENASRSGKLQHFYINVSHINNLPADQTPRRVRIRLKPRGYVPGDAVQITAVLYRPPIPALVGGYDAARAAFYNQIGGYGFAISKPQMIELETPLFANKLKRKISMLRYTLSRHIQTRAPPRTSGLQSALLTGDRSGITDSQKQSLRDAGLAHLLAISGLHMGLLAGGAYSLASFLFAMVGPLARRYDMRKWAAVVGGCVASVYLIMSGASVSTQRAFIMAIVIFAAVIFGRRAVSLRSVSLAAAITLVLHPESLLSAGFQMSFSATAALVVVYRSWASRKQYYSPRSFITRIRNWFVGLSVTSLVAGAATGGFAALHFHRFARLGFFANLAAMPIFTLIVMPSGFIAILLMPLGLDAFPLKIMGVGLDGVLLVSDWISSKDTAIVYIKSANGIVVSVFGLGFYLLCLGPRALRAVGGLMALIACVMWAGLERPDMRVSDTARVSFWDENEVDLLRVDRKRGDKFGRKRFSQQAGVEAMRMETYLDTMAYCDHIACRFTLKNYQISVVHTPEGVVEACLDSQLVILTLRKAGPRARRLCTAIILDANDLSSHGARDIYLGESGIDIRPSNPDSRKARPWGQ